MSLRSLLKRAFELRGSLANVRGISPAVQRSWLATAASSPDPAAQPKRAKEVLRNPAERMLSVTWHDGSTNRYPFVYLRDICRCPQCFHDSSLQRSLDPVRELDSNMLATKVDVDTGGRQITLTWPNGHVTSFDSDWLHERRLPEDDEQRVEEERNFMRKDVVLWGWGTGADIPTLAFDDIIKNESTQMKWLEMIGSHGLVLITGAPKDQGQVNKLGDVLGYLKVMWFGETHQVENRVGGEFGTCVASMPQASCAYNEYRGGLHLVHCRQELAGTGGEHLFVDGFNIAQHLKDNDPDGFERLCTARILYQRSVANEDATLKLNFTHPVIGLDHTGCLSKVIYNEKYRSSFVNVPAEDIPSVYRTYFEVSRMIMDPGYTIKHRLHEGDIIAVDCDRVLQGRDPFAPEVEGNEVLECGFSDKDMTSSWKRILEKRLSSTYTGFEADEPLM